MPLIRLLIRFVADSMINQWLAFIDVNISICDFTHTNGHAIGNSNQHTPDLSPKRATMIWMTL